MAVSSAMRFLCHVVDHQTRKPIKTGGISFTWQDMVRGDPSLLPQLLGFQVWFKARIRVPFKVGDVEAVRAERKDLRQELPRQVDRLLLEVVAKGPRQG